MPDRRRPGSAVGRARHGCDFQHLHRNKRSLSLNLKAHGRRDVLMRLVDAADVLVENMRPPVKHRLGFDFGTVHARNPRLVYGSISGFGQDGPYAEPRRRRPDRPGHGRADERAPACRAPSRRASGFRCRISPPVSISPSAILVALHDRDRTG